MQNRIRIALLASAILSGSAILGQNCFFSADFEDGSIPSGWTSSSAVIIATGESTDAWTVGTAADANAGGFFPVPDIAIGNRFAMANDDAPPCDCVMDLVHLTTPAIDLSARSNVAMRCRIFHEMTLGSGAATVEASTNGADWIMVDSVDAVFGTWQDVYIDLAAYDGAPSFQLRFSWSDAGEWASGVAVDDVCLFERLAHDLAVVSASVNDPSASPFNMAARTLPYTRMPLTQASGLTGSVVVENRGSATLNDIVAGATITLNSTNIGDATGSTLPSLEPGERAVLVVTGLPTPSAAGNLSIDFAVGFTGAADEDPSNNQMSAPVRITASGWEDGYGAMALDDGSAQGSIGSELGFIAANRFELTTAGTAYGMSAVLGTDSQLGEEVRAILMDGNLAFIDTSDRHVITQDDIDLAWGSGALLLTFSTTPSLTAGDYLVGLQRLSGSGRVSVATSGNCTQGASAFLEGITFDVTWTTSVPMVRLHLDELGVGLADEPAQAGLGMRVVPHPIGGDGFVLFDADLAGPVNIKVFDSAGRIIRLSSSSVSEGRRVPFSTASIPAGAYVLEATVGGRIQRIPLIVAH